jgi:RNA polymerase sigma-70 factor (ECF subfamily)
MGNKVSDETLMLEYAQGDAAAFETLYRRHKDAMYRYLLRQCQNSAIAEELFQDIWLRIVNARQNYSVKASFRTWLYQIAHNRLIDHYRRQNTRKLESYLDNAVLENTASTEVSDPQRIVNGQQQATQLLELIADLPEAQREAFLLKEEAGMTLEEIAAATGAKSETVKSRLRYAFNRLRQKMGLD